MIEFCSSNTYEALQADRPAVVAFYGIARQKTLAGVYERALEWFRQHGHEPHKAGATGQGYSGRFVGFRNFDKKVRSGGFDTLESIELLTLRPGSEQSGNFLLIVDIVRSDYVVLAIDNSIMCLRDLVDSSIVPDLLRLMRPAYAIGYARDRHLGPAFYAVGITQGLAHTGEEYEEARRISRWLDIGNPQQVFRRGLLRDVYEVSFLNESQLSANVGSVPLVQWISQDPGRGELTPAEVGLHRWTVPMDCIAGVRSELWDAGVIFDWRRHCA